MAADRETIVTTMDLVESREQSLAIRVGISAGQGNLHFFNTAAFVRREALLVRYQTTIYASPAIRAFVRSRLGGWLIGRRRAARILQQCRPELDSSPIAVYTSTELVERLLRKGVPLLRSLWPRYADRAFNIPMVWYGWLSSRQIPNCDIFHVRSGYGRYAIRAAKRLGAVCLVDHSIADSSFLFDIFPRESKKWSDGSQKADYTEASFASVNRDLNDADHVVVNSEFVKETLIRAGRVEPDRITVLYWGTDTDFFCPPEQPSGDAPFTILFVGSLDYRKGALYLLEAYRRLNWVDARLVIVGPQQGQLPLASYEDSFTHVPSASRAEVRAWYQKASVFAFPSLAEGSARVLFEAMASSLPVVTTREAGSIARDGIDGHIVAAGDIEGLANALTRLRSNPSQAVEMGRNGRERILNEFTWSHYESGLLRLYSQLTERRRPID
jgi:glycosyltransferase involved in cell wall biosynthesis